MNILASPVSSLRRLIAADWLSSAMAALFCEPDAPKEGRRRHDMPMWICPGDIAGLGFAMSFNSSDLHPESMPQQSEVGIE